MPLERKIIVNPDDEFLDLLLKYNINGDSQKNMNVDVYIYK